MELQEFVIAFRQKIRARRAELMETYNKGLEQREYDKTVGRIRTLDEVNATITELLKTSGEDQ